MLKLFLTMAALDYLAIHHSTSRISALYMTIQLFNLIGLHAIPHYRVSYYGNGIVCNDFSWIKRIGTNSSGTYNSISSIDVMHPITGGSWPGINITQTQPVSYIWYLTGYLTQSPTSVTSNLLITDQTNSLPNGYFDGFTTSYSVTLLLNGSNNFATYTSFVACDDGYYLTLIPGSNTQYYCTQCPTIIIIIIIIIITNP